MKNYEIDFLKIENKNMIRDMSNKALISNDINELKAYRDRKQTIATMKDAMEEINSTKAEIAEIKKMLKIILEKI